MKVGFSAVLGVLVVFLSSIQTVSAFDGDGSDAHVEKDVCYRTGLPGSGRSQSEAMSNARAKIRDCNRGFSQSKSTCQENNPGYWYCLIEGTCCHWEP